MHSICEWAKFVYTCRGNAIVSVRSCYAARTSAIHLYLFHCVVSAEVHSRTLCTMMANSTMSDSIIDATTSSFTAFKHGLVAHICTLLKLTANRSIEIRSISDQSRFVSYLRNSAATAIKTQCKIHPSPYRQVCKSAHPFRMPPIMKIIYMSCLA